MPSKAPLARRCVSGVAITLCTLGGAATAVMMFVTTGDAIGLRFGQGIPGALQFSELLMTVVVFLPLMLVQLRRENIGIELATRWMPARARAALDALWALVAMGLIGWVAWLCADRAVQGTRVQETLSGIVEVPLWPFRWFLPVGLGLLAVAFLITAIEHVREAITGSRTDSAAEQADPGSDAACAALGSPPTRSAPLGSDQPTVRSAP